MTLRRLLRGLAWTVGVLTVVAAVALAGVGVWLAEGDEAAPGPLVAVRADPDVEVVEADGVVVVRPAGTTPSTGLVFYPGARIERDAYVATIAPVVVETGIAAFVPGMPLNWAMFDADRAVEVRADHPEITTWLLGGHSLGGLTATRLVDERPDVAWQGLVLWAATAARGVELDDRTLPTLVVGGELDSRVPTDFLDAGAAQLPNGTEQVGIAGMSHWQFGRYGKDPAPGGRDDDATLAELVDLTAAFVVDVVAVP